MPGVGPTGDRMTTPEDPEASPGFTIWPGVISEREVAGLIATLAATDRSRAGVRHLMAHPAVTALAGDSRLVALAQSVLGASAQPYRATLFEKSGKSNWLVVWHQDTALPLRSRTDRPGWGPWSRKAGVLYAHAPAAALERVVALRLHLDDSTSENGPLRVLPGTHTVGVLSDAELQALAKRVTPRECTVDQGGIICMRPLLVHASSKSRVSAPRRVLHIEYAPSLQLEAELELDVA
jgi:ectoine hydroxylase-related dioxygenase (phytanoyl-CoA dioxygenase family)